MASISSTGEPSWQPQMMSGSGGVVPKLIAIDVLADIGDLKYLKAVKDVFNNDKEKYHDFLKLVTDFKAQRIDRLSATARVEELFKGHSDLIFRFKAFSKRYEDQRAKAIKMLGKIKSRFEGDDCVYKSFLDILKMRKNERKSIPEVYQEVVALFQGHEDLLEELNHYLLDTPVTASTLDEFARNFMLHDMSSAKPTRERTMDSRGEFEWTMDDRAKRRKSLALDDAESSKKEN